MRNILFIITIIIYLPFVSEACSPPTPHDKSKVKSLLYKVEDCDGNTSYIFGTMHSDNAQIVAIAKEASQHMTGINTALFEMDERESEPSNIAKFFFIPPTHKAGLKTLAGASLFNQLMARLKQKRLAIPEQAINRYRPWAAAMLLQIPPSENDGVVSDAHLQNNAKSHSIEIIGLERAEEQFRPFLRMPMEWQLSTLKDAVERYEEGVEDTHKLQRFYLAGDLAQMQALATESFGNVEPRQIGEYIERTLIIDRNRLMAARAEKYIQRGDAFIAVGALHLPGSSGLLRHYERLGYDVTPVKLESLVTDK